MDAQPTYRMVETKAQTEYRLDYLFKQIGVKEKTGKNDGKKIDEYNRIAGAPRYSPWCMSVTYASHYYSCIATSAKPYWLRTGSTQLFASWVEKNAQRINTSVVPGTVIIYRSPNKINGHAFTVSKVHNAGWVSTLEGNTSNGAKGSQREGNGFYQRTRNIMHPLANMLLRCAYTPA